jgi:hypothetical protein
MLGTNSPKKKKKRQKIPVPADAEPPTLGEYLSHLFDRNAMRTVAPAALTDAQFFWLLNDLGLGLMPDEITVLCRRAPEAGGKVRCVTHPIHTYFKRCLYHRVATKSSLDSF